MFRLFDLSYCIWVYLLHFSEPVLLSLCINNNCYSTVLTYVTFRWRHGLFVPTKESNVPELIENNSLFLKHTYRTIGCNFSVYFGVLRQAALHECSDNKQHNENNPGYSYTDNNFTHSSNCIVHVISWHRFHVISNCNITIQQCHKWASNISLHVLSWINLFVQLSTFYVYLLFKRWPFFNCCGDSKVAQARSSHHISVIGKWKVIKSNLNGIFGIFLNLSRPWTNTYLYVCHANNKLFIWQGALPSRVKFHLCYLVLGPTLWGMSH